MVGFPNKPIGFPTKNDQHLGWRLGVPPFKEHPSFETTIWNNHFEIQWRSQTPLHFGSKRAVLTLTRGGRLTPGSRQLLPKNPRQTAGIPTAWRVEPWLSRGKFQVFPWSAPRRPLEMTRWLRRWWWRRFQRFFGILHPETWGRCQPDFWLIFFKFGLVQPRTRWVFFSGKGFQVGTHGLFRAHRIHGYTVYLPATWMVDL